MIDWLYQSTLDISILLVVILLIRNPVRRILGAHVSYWLWSLPVLRLIIADKFNRPDVITRYLKVPETSDFIPVYSGPIQASETQIEVLAIVWMIGFVSWSLIKIIQSIGFKRWLNQNSKLLSYSEYMSDDLLNNFKLKIQFKSCGVIEGPLITGIIKPTVYLPDSFSVLYNKVEQQLILEHELTHAKRLDLWAQLLAEIFKAIFWFNPLVHVAWMKFQLDQELACDHQILKNTDSNTRQAYGNTLKKGLSAFLTPSSLTFFNHKHERFIMLTKHKNNIFTTLTGVLFIATLGIMMLTRATVTLAEKPTAQNGIDISLNFIQIPLNQVVKLIADTTPQEELLVQLDLLDGIDVTTQVEYVPAFDFLDILLKEHGFKVDRHIDNWKFSKL